MTPLLHALHYQPWLITPETHAAMLRALSRTELFSQDLPQPPEPELLSVENGVGIVTIHGALMKRPDFFARLLLGATDMEDVAVALEAARDRADVHAVFLDVDSPGGTVNGTPELAALVSDVSKAELLPTCSQLIQTKIKSRTARRGQRGLILQFVGLAAPGSPNKTTN